jgi:hypothetical protein
MIKHFLHIIAWLTLTPLLLSCEQQTNWDLQSGGEFLVADCIITNEMKYHEMRLYRSADRLNQSPEGFSGVTVQLSDGSISVSFGEDNEEPGRYVSAVPFMASAGKLYQLTLSFNGRSDTAYAMMTGVSPLEAIDIVASDGIYRFIYHQSTPASMTEVYYNWSADSQYCEQYGACQAAEVYYSLDNIDMSKEFAPDKQVILFPRKTMIIRRKYSLSEDHQQFIRSLLLETEWRGGLFDVEQGNVPTNFHHGVRGWFAACSVVSDTTFFE